MAHIPLMSEQDLEEGDLPTYEDTQNQKNNGQHYFPASKTVEHEAAVAQAHVTIRLGFLRKVFGILSFQFLATFVFCFVLYLTPGVRGFVQQQSWIVLLTAVGSIGVFFAMFIHARNTPLNYFLLAAWTILQALLVASVVTFFDVEVVIQAILLTSIVVGSLFVYTLQTKRDFQQHYAIMYTVSCVFIGAIFLQILVMSPMFDFLISVAGALFFSVYLVIDVQFVMNHCSEEDYILACVMIYTDIIGLFLRILEILNEINRN
jgi:FtsH-binding integral membrane protein